MRIASKHRAARHAAHRFEGIEPLEPRILLAADLVVTAVTDTASSYSTGNLIQAEAHIANVGSLFSNSGPFDLEFWLSKNGVTSRYRFIESGFVLNVLRGIPTSDIINFPGWQIPTDIPQGTYHITVYLDTDNDVAEENEGNNVGKSANFTIGQPDLRVPSVTVPSTTYGHGQFLQAEATISNTGLGSTFPQAPLGFDLAFYLGTADGTNKTLYHIEDGFVTYLNGGQSTTDIINFPGWLIPADVPIGSYRVWVKADTGADVVESNEGNNWGSSGVIQIGLPDLRITSVELSGGDQIYAYNELLSAVAHIDNVGPGSTLAQAPLGFNVSFYLGAVNATTDAQRMIYNLEDAIVTWLHGGQSTTDNLNQLILPTSFQPGEYRLWVKADSSNTVVELNENNNWGSSSILTIQGARWEDANGNLLGDTIAEATPIYLAVYTDRVNPSADIPVNIWEDDISLGDVGNDFLEEVTLEHIATAAGHKWRRQWIPYRTQDLVSGIGGDPEYFFRVKNSDHLPGLFDASSNVNVAPNPGEFGVKLLNHTIGDGVPLVLVHGNGSDLAFDLYRWKPFLNWIEDHPALFAEFDVWLWKHDTSRAVGFNGAAGSQADRLAGFIYDTLDVGKADTQYEHAKVALVGHSQGGLVSRSFMNTYNDALGHAQGEDVSTLITINTPHHGSPFGTEDWVAVLWSQLFGDGPLGEIGFNALRNNYLGRDDGDLNLAWSNLDGVVHGAVASFAGWVSNYVLTPHDTNQISAYPDPSVVYRDSLKAQYGTLAELNTNEAFIHKLVTIGAYDTSLADNVSPAAFATELIANGALPEHEALSAVTNLMAMMSGSQLNNSNSSNYLANDGLVPLQSSLLLDMPLSGTSYATLDAGLNVNLNTNQIAAHAPRDMLYHIFSSDDGIADHADVLETTNTSYWMTITNQLRAVLETTPPTAALLDPVDEGTIPAAVLNDRRYIDIEFSDTGGSTLDPTSVLDTNAEFTLTGAGAAAVILDAVPLRLDGYDNVYRYSFTGDFVPGVIEVSFVAGSAADDAGNLNPARVTTINVITVPPPLAGDLDGNGQLDAFDVDDFEQALSDRQAYVDSHPGLDPDQLGDLDGNGVLDAFDVDDFESALAASGGATPLADTESAAPEEQPVVALADDDAGDSILVANSLTNEPSTDLFAIQRFLTSLDVQEAIQHRSRRVESRGAHLALWQHIEGLLANSNARERSGAMLTAAGGEAVNLLAR